MNAPKIVTPTSMNTSRIAVRTKEINDLNDREVMKSSSKVVTLKSLKKNDEHNKGKEEITYSKLLKELRGTGKLWEDPDFPANSTSAFYSTHSKMYTQFQWMRPKEITPNAQLFSDGVSQFDVQQGQLGDCWLLAVVATLSLYKPLFKNVVPYDQDFDKNYIGAFRFRFWNFGKWKEVIVDDRIPTKYRKLVYLHSSDSNEYWSALLEKAYAKLCGNYEALSGGNQAEAMEDLTGGLCETIKLNAKKVPVDLYKHLLMYMSHSSLMGCDIVSKIVEGFLQNGLITGHAYSITGVQQVKQENGKIVDLIRVRNPWGDDREWNGRWSDNAPEWNTISEKNKRKLCDNFKKDGEFWINFEDFVQNFTKLDICHLGPTSLDSGLHGKNRWEMSLVEGRWTKNVTAGGCRNFIDSFGINPQYRVQIIDPDNDNKENKGTVIVGVMQKDMRKKRLQYFQIGYIIYKITDSKCGVLNNSYFKYNKSITQVTFYNEREVYGKHILPIGHYVIIPSTYNPNEEADFIMRIFTQKANKSKALDMKNEVYDIFKYLDVTDSKKDANIESELEGSFKKVCQPKKGINSFELRRILNETIAKDMKGFNGFHYETCRSMIALADIKYNGLLNFFELYNLLKLIQLWKLAFKKFDENDSGLLKVYDFRNALLISGFSVCNSVFQILANRYSDTEEGVIIFEDFIMASIRLYNAFETMKHQPKDSMKRLCFSTDEFMINLLNI